MAHLDKRDYAVSLLVIQPGDGALLDAFTQQGFPAANLSNRSLSLPGAIFAFAEYLKRNPADLILAHQQMPALIALLARQLRMVQVPVIAFRHFCLGQIAFPDGTPDWRLNQKERWVEAIINRLADRIVVPAQAVRNTMVQDEGIPAHRIEVIPYQYETDSMVRTVSETAVADIQQRYPAKVRLISVMRFIETKWHKSLVDVMVQLKAKGVDATLILPDVGPLLKPTQAYAQAAGVSDRLHFVGYQNNILDWIAACDMLLFPSLTEASNSVVKEAGLLGKPVVVVEGVGDYAEYVVHGESGILATPEVFVQAAVAAVEALAAGTLDGHAMGEALKQAVVGQFSVSAEVIAQYQLLIQDFAARRQPVPLPPR